MGNFNHEFELEVTATFDGEVSYTTSPERSDEPASITLDDVEVTEVELLGVSLRASMDVWSAKTAVMELLAELGKHAGDEAMELAQERVGDGDGGEG